MSAITIGGAGIAGLTAAIHLVKNNHEVVVHEINCGIGRRPKSYQGFSPMNPTDRWKIKEYFRERKLKIGFHYSKLNEHEVVLDNNKRINFSYKKPYFLIDRGGPASLEYSLYKQAKKEGVIFNFNADARKQHADIVATGPSRIDYAGFGKVYEGANLPKDKGFTLFDDRFSPRGLYLYVFPRGKNRVEVLNGVSRPFVPKIREYYEKAVQHPRVKEILDGANPLYTFGGIGNYFVPHSAQRNGSLYAGEAAGFQDPFMGFGMCLAIESGILAARAINEKIDYDMLWKNTILPSLILQYGRRFFTSILGSRVISYYLRNGIPKTRLNEDWGQNFPFLDLFAKIQMSITRN